MIKAEVALLSNNFGPTVTVGLRRTINNLLVLTTNLVFGEGSILNCQSWAGWVQGPQVPNTVEQGRFRIVYVRFGFTYRLYQLWLLATDAKNPVLRL